MYEFSKKKVQNLATSGPPEIWQDHQISRVSGPMAHCLEVLVSSPVRDSSFFTGTPVLDVPVVPARCFVNPSANTE